MRTSKRRNPKEIRAVAEAANFRSREPSADEAPVSGKRTPRRYRTGRNVQFNIEAKQQTVEAFYAITDREDWALSETLERAVAALERELEAERGNP